MIIDTQLITVNIAHCYTWYRINHVDNVLKKNVEIDIMHTTREV